MILYTPLPLEQVLEGNDCDSRQYREVEVDGIKVMVESLSLASGKVVRIISTDPKHYLLPHLQPGQVLQFFPKLKDNGAD